MVIYAIFFCGALVGHPYFNVCQPADSSPYASLEECKTQAAKIAAAQANGARVTYLCMKSTATSAWEPAE